VNTPRRPQLGGSQGVVFEVRDYSALLALSENLQTYNRYLSTAGMQERGEAWGQFDAARRKFVFELCQDHTGDPVEILPAIWADLEDDAITGQYGDVTISFVREELTKHIRKQSGKNSFQRHVMRWGQPTFVTAITIAAFYFLYLRFTGGLP